MAGGDSRRRVRGEERQHGLTELARPDLRQGMTAARKDLDLGAGNQPRQLLGEIGRRDDVVLGANDEGRRLDLPELRGSVEGEDRVEPAGLPPGWRKGGERLRLHLTQALV